MRTVPANLLPVDLSLGNNRTTSVTWTTLWSAAPPDAALRYRFDSLQSHNGLASCPRCWVRSWFRQRIRAPDKHWVLKKYIVVPLSIAIAHYWEVTHKPDSPKHIQRVTQTPTAKERRYGQLDFAISAFGQAPSWIMRQDRV